MLEQSIEIKQMHIGGEFFELSVNAQNIIEKFRQRQAEFKPIKAESLDNKIIVRVAGDITVTAGINVYIKKLSEMLAGRSKNLTQIILYRNLDGRKGLGPRQ